MPLRYNNPAPAPAPAGGIASSATGYQAPAPVRDLSQLRTQLAGSGGVNPPESKVPETALEPRTEETPTGGAQPIQTGDKPVQPLPDTPTTRRTRRTPAQMAEARAQAASAASATQSTATTSPPVTGAATGSPVNSAGDVSKLGEFTLAALLAEVVRRVKVEL